MKHEISIALISTQADFLSTVVTIHSLLSSQSSTTACTIHWFSDFALGREQTYVDDLKTRFPGSRIETHFEGLSRAVSMGSGTSASSTDAIKFRLPELLPNVDKLLYIASDTLVQKDLVELFSVDLRERHLAATGSLIKYKDEFHLRKYGEKVGVPLGDYVDSSVMLLNLAAMRRDDVTRKLLEFSASHRDLSFGDQDAFNAVCRSRTLTLPRRFNLSAECCDIAALSKHASNPDEAVILRFNATGGQKADLARDWYERYWTAWSESPAKSLRWEMMLERGKSVLTRKLLRSVKKVRRRARQKLKRLERSFLLSQQQEFREDLDAFFTQHDLLSRAMTCSEIGTNASPRTPRVIVSLTTIPPRLPEITTTIESLLRQTMKPDAVILWIDQARVSPSDLPALLRRQLDRGLSVRFCEDIGPHTKLIPALKEYPDDIIITVDDDILYRVDLVERFIREHEKDRSLVLCNEARFISVRSGREFSYSRNWQRIDTEIQGLNVLPLGVGGVLYPPKVLSEEVFNLGLQRELSPKADDIWFKAMSLKKSVICKRISGPRQPAPMRPFSQDVALHKTNVREGGNERQVQACFDYFNLWSVLGVEE